jgi:hypothetical protein
MSQSHRVLLDRFAVVLSLVCMIHCLALPLIVAVLPIVGSTLLPDREFHWLMLLLVLPASLWALTSGYRHHRRIGIAAVGAFGLGVLLGVSLLGHELFGLAGERLATSVGSIFVAAAHVLNYRRRHSSLQGASSVAR